MRPPLLHILRTLSFCAIAALGTGCKGMVVEGASRLTMQLYGSAVSQVTSDTVCGFKSPAVLASAVTSGNLGERNGTATFTIATPCTLSLPSQTEVSSDCAGNKTYLQGSATVTGTLTLKGILTGDVNEPIIPTSRDPAAAALTFNFQNFTVSDNAEHSLQVTSGTLSGTLSPRMALDTSLGACAISTPVATFQNVAWKNAKVVVGSGSMKFDLNIDSSSLSAQNGSRDGVTNALSGTITSDGQSFQAPTTLNPDYDQAKFDLAYQCKPNMKVPATEKECSLHDTMGQNAARLLIQNVAAMASIVNEDSYCGFADTMGVLIYPTRVEGAVGQQGLLEWKINDCVVGSYTPKSYWTSCQGIDKYYEGVIRVDATRTVTGLREDMYYIFDSIVPRERLASTLVLDNIEVWDWAVYSVPQGATQPRGMRIHTGIVKAKMVPVLGERASKPGAFDVGTQVAEFTEVELTNAVATAFVGGKQFKLNLPSVKVQAMAGGYKGRINQMQGTAVVDGVPVTIPPMALDPTYKQAEYDATYACTPDLKATVPPN